MSEAQNNNLPALKRMRNIARRYKKLVDRIGNIELSASLLECELFDLVAEIERLGGNTPQFGGRASGNIVLTRGAVTRAPFQKLAESGASSIEIRFRPDGVADLRIDGGKQFTLPPSLADLISILAMDTEAGSPPQARARGGRDGLVRWKPKAEVRELLSKQSGTKVSERALTQAVYRLRRELFNRGGINPHLVQTSRRYGLRFAVRCRPDAKIGD